MRLGFAGPRLIKRGSPHRPGYLSQVDVNPNFQGQHEGWCVRSVGRVIKFRDRQRLYCLFFGPTHIESLQE